VSSVHLLLTSWQWATSVVPVCLPKFNAAMDSLF
jgi:hypothetical protein